MSVKNWKPVRSRLAVVDKGGGEVADAIRELIESNYAQIEARKDRGEPVWRIEATKFVER